MLQVSYQCLTTTAHISSCFCAGFEQPADVSKQVTELIPHPTPGDADDRDPYGGAAASVLQPAETAPSSLLVGGPEYDAEPDVVESGATRDVGVQVCADSTHTTLALEHSSGQC